MKFHKMPFAVLVFYYILTLAISVGIYFVLDFIFVSTTLFFFILTWLLGAVLLFVLFLYLPLFYLNYGYAITHNSVIVKRGVVFYKIHYLPRDKVSFVTIYKTPFSNLLDACTIILTAPGKFMVIQSVRIERANMIFEALSKKSMNEIEEDSEE